MADWERDSDQLAANLIRVLVDARDLGRSVMPSSETMRSWHGDLMAGLEAPDRNWIGRFRGESGLEDVTMKVGDATGLDPGLVADALAQFDRVLAAAVTALDAALPVSREPDADQLSAVVDLCAWAHAEWVRIHPFGNGNGRTARLWANALAMRYDLPPFVGLRPRPDAGYVHAAIAAMEGDWQATIPVFRSMLGELLES